MKSKFTLRKQAAEAGQQEARKEVMMKMKREEGEREEGRDQDQSILAVTMKAAVTW